MKIELKKQITKVTGDVYYYVTVDGNMQIGTWTSTYPDAMDAWAKAVEGAKLFPETIIQTIEEYEQ
jgi:hypothetical protein